ncbi:hypothetical protein BgiBS90_016209, partial [Biomphalaria glabrata]
MTTTRLTTKKKKTKLFITWSEKNVSACLLHTLHSQGKQKCVLFLNNVTSGTSWNRDPKDTDVIK